jgi:glycosyltransferase involved in cell wall biosynthesis
MKKLLIFPGYFPPHVGGLESHVDELVRRLCEKGFKIIIFAPNIPGAKEYEKINENLKVIRYPAFDVITNFPMPKFWGKDFRKHLKDFKKEEFDIVTSRTRFFYSSFLACRFAKKNNIRFIHVEHGSEYVKLKNPLTTFIAWLYDKTLGAYVIKKADLCIAISKSSERFLRRFRKKGEIPIITRGVEFDYIDKIKKYEKIREIYKDKIIIGFVGRIIHWKGLYNALSGFEMLEKEEKKKCVFAIVGDGPDKKSLESRFKSKNIIFLGKKTRDESISLMKTFDIYIHSTISGGGLSNSLLEAASVGSAIIATKAEGADEVLDDKSAVMIEKSEPILFREALLKMINNKDFREKLKINAKTNVRKSFNWDNKIKQYEKVLG